MTPWRVGSSVAVWVVLSASLWASGSNPAVLVLGGIVLVGSALIFVGLDLARSVSRVRWPQRITVDRPVQWRDDRVAKLVRDAKAEASSKSTHLHSILVELLDDRLAAHHNIDRVSDPELAASMLTPTLRRFVSGPHPRVARRRELQQVLSDIEAL